MKRFAAIAILSSVMSACWASDPIEASFMASFLECDESISMFLQANESALTGYAATSEARPGFRWFRMTTKTGEIDQYAKFNVPLKIGPLTIVGAGYLFSADDKSEFWGLYFKENIRTVKEGLKTYAPIREMRYVNVAGEHFARLRYKKVGGKTMEWVNILEPVEDSPIGASSYLSCSVQPQPQG